MEGTTVHVWDVMAYLIVARSEIHVEFVEGMVHHVLPYPPLAPLYYPPLQHRDVWSVYMERA